MDRREQEESSSSQSVNPRIQSIQERGTSGTLLSVVLEEGSSFFMAPELFRTDDLWISPGAVCSSDRIRRLQSLEQETQCRQKALDLLARRIHSSFELKRKLLQRKFPSEMVENCCIWLENKGFLNDEDYAEQWLKGRIRRGGESRQTLMNKLREKGISREIISQTFLSYSEENEKSALDKAWTKLMRRPSMTEEKALQSLQRKGFSYKSIRQYLAGD